MMGRTFFSPPRSISVFAPRCCLLGSYLRLIDFVDHSTLGLRVIKKKRREAVRVLRWGFRA